MLQIFKLFLASGEFSGVFCIKRGDITLAYCHIVNGFICQRQRAGCLVALLFVVQSVVPVMVHGPDQRDNQQDDGSAMV
jgi:hypothetical protein